MKPLRVGPSERERFLAAVAEQVPVDRVVELYLFQPIRQGGVESGVAVIAAAADRPDAAEAPAAPGVVAAPADLPIESEEPTPLASGAEPDAQGALSPPSAGAAPRYTVFTARYRHVLKGPERGRWEVSVIAEAEAPLATVGAVVRGVQRRAGDVEPPEHISGDALRDALTGGPPTEP